MGAAEEAIQNCEAQVYARNLREVDPFVDLVQGYSHFLAKSLKLAQSKQELKNEVIHLGDERDALVLKLKEAEESAAKGAEAQELQARVGSLQTELGEAYKMNASVSQQLVTATTALQGTSREAEEKTKRVEALEELLDGASTHAANLETMIKERDDALELAARETANWRAEAEATAAKLAKLEVEHKELVDRWMEQKLKDADKMNEIVAMYEDMVEHTKAARLEELARRQSDGVVRAVEAGAEEYVPAGLPSAARHTLRAHEGACSTLCFEHGSGVLVTGGDDRVARIWESLGGKTTGVLRGGLGAVLDVAVSMDNKLCLAGCSDHKVLLWELDSGRVRHTLTGHTEKVCAVDFSRTGGNRAASAAHDRTVKVWDLVSGYGVTTLLCFSNCTSLAVLEDGALAATGHMDGSLRVWDLRSGKLANEVAAHVQGITSVSLSASGTSLLTAGRDNCVNLWDARSFEVRASFRAPGYRVATNWSRACMSPDSRYIAAGSADGAVYVWSEASRTVERVLRAHTAPVLSCAWSKAGRPLASADKSGNVVLWE